MNWLDRIRGKSSEQKIRLIWQITIFVGIILVVLWIFLGRYDNGAKKNIDLFKTIGNGIKNFNSTPNDATPSIPGDSKLNSN